MSSVEFGKIVGGDPVKAAYLAETFEAVRDLQTELFGQDHPIDSVEVFLVALGATANDLWESEEPILRAAYLLQTDAEGANPDFKAVRFADFKPAFGKALAQGDKKKEAYLRETFDLVKGIPLFVVPDEPITAVSEQDFITALAAAAFNRRKEGNDDVDGGFFMRGAYALQQLAAEQKPDIKPVSFADFKP